MGFFDESNDRNPNKGILDRLGEAAGKTYARQKNNYNRAAERSMDRSDERLINAYKNERDLGKKKAMENELRRRGYGREK